MHLPRSRPPVSWRWGWWRFYPIVLTLVFIPFFYAAGAFSRSQVLYGVVGLVVGAVTTAVAIAVTMWYLRLPVRPSRRA